MSDTLQKIREIQTFDVQVGMNQEIHVILINHDQNKSYRDQQFISFVQNGLAIEDNACTRQNSCKDTPVQ